MAGEGYSQALLPVSETRGHSDTIQPWVPEGPWVTPHDGSKGPGGRSVTPLHSSSGAGECEGPGETCSPWQHKCRLGFYLWVFPEHPGNPHIPRGKLATWPTMVLLPAFCIGGGQAWLSLPTAQREAASTGPPSRTSRRRTPKWHPLLGPQTGCPQSPPKSDPPG